MKPFEPDSLPLESLDWAALVRDVGPANAALARYDGILQGMVNPGILLSPLKTQEAVLSSKIEGTQATLEEVLEFQASNKTMPEAREDIQEVVNYSKALSMAVDALEQQPLSLRLLKQIHSVLLKDVRGRNRARGEFRRIQNWIGKPGSDMENASYVPPHPGRLLDDLSNWEKYVHYDEHDPLVQLAFVHAQFELIHPFLDGNGRVGRIIIPLFLFDKGLLSTPMFFLSPYLEANRSIYYEKLLAISQVDDWTGWISFFLRAVTKQAQSYTAKAKVILELYDEMKQKIAKITRSHFAIQVLDSIFDMPVFTTTDFIQRTGIRKQTAMRILNALEGEGILATVQEARGRQPAMFAFPKLIDIVRT